MGRIGRDKECGSQEGQGTETGKRVGMAEKDWWAWQRKEGVTEKGRCGRERKLCQKEEGENNRKKGESAKRRERGHEVGVP